MAGFPEADFCLHLDFQRQTENPTRVFQGMINLINALQAVESDLLHNVQPELETVFILEDLETSSLKTWIKRKVNGTLQSIDLVALESGDWKRIAGTYLSKGVQKLIQKTNPDIPTTRESLQVLSQELETIAEETGLRRLTLHEPLPLKQIAMSLMTLASAIEPLAPGDSINFITPFGETPMRTGFCLTRENLEDLLTNETISNTYTEILKIRKPDLLGDAQWEFRLGKDTFVAKIADVNWLHRFRTRHVRLQSGDSLRVRVRTISKYGHDGELISLKHEIQEVVEEIHLPPEPLPPALEA